MGEVQRRAWKCGMEDGEGVPVKDGRTVREKARKRGRLRCEREQGRERKRKMFMSLKKHTGKSGTAIDL